MNEKKPSIEHTSPTPIRNHTKIASIEHIEPIKNYYHIHE